MDTLLQVQSIKDTFCKKCGSYRIHLNTLIAKKGKQVLKINIFGCVGCGKLDKELVTDSIK